MAAESDRMKQVSFLGAWRTQHVSDQLLRQISNQIASKKKVATQLNISTEGLELLIFNNEGKLTRKDKIALENIVDFIDNKYRTTCTLAIVREKQQKLYTVFVFLCKSDRDAASLIHTFKTVKRQLSGEGYNTNLTPKGKNWVLQPKSEKVLRQTVNNGDLRGTVPANHVRVINTEKQNGGVVMINTNDRNDSFSHESIKTSNSEVKEELHNLADEVRGIKKLLQGSKGRAQFEKHYGYKILQSPPPVERQVMYVNERNIDTRPIEPIPGNIYVKNETNARYVNDGPQVIRVGGRVSRSTRQYKTKGHFASVRSPTRQEYTKRVYNSQNPYAESGLGIQPVKIIGRTTPPQQVIVPRQRFYQPASQSSDIIHKNIEDVYRSRSVRKIYLPQSSQNSKTVEYVRSHVVEAAPQDPQLARQKVVVSRETQPKAVHVKYNPEVRTLYESRNEESVKVESNSHASTDVNTSVNDNLEDKMKQIESSLDIEQREIRQEGNDNVIVIKTIEEVSQGDISENRENVMYAQNEESRQLDQPSSNEGNVYHVRAEFKDEYESHFGQDDRVTVISSSVVSKENVENERSVVHDENVTVISYDSPQTNDVHVERSVNENTEVFKDDAVKSDTEDVKIEIERQLSERLQNEREDGGLFGAYTKKPEDHNEPTDEISRESAYRYHDDEDETIIRADTTRILHASNRIAVYEPEEENAECISEIMRGVAHADNENGSQKEEIEDEGINMEKNIEVIEEKHVRYNETIEQIPLADDESENLAGSVKHTRDMFEAATQENNVSQNDFKSELSSVVSRIRHNYDEKLREEESEHVEEEEEEQYVLDMDALKAYSTEPDIVIVDAGNEKTIATVDAEMDENEKINTLIPVDMDEKEESKTIIPVDTSENESAIETDIKDSREIVNDDLDDEVLKIEGEHLDMFNRVNESEIQVDQKQTTGEDIDELINTTEDKVLF